jgi:hypothetical protein
MKTYQIVLFFAAMVSLTAPSCKKYYENVPVEQVTPDYIWDTRDSAGVLANAYLTTIYTYLPLGFNRINTDFLDAASDDAISSQSGASDISTMAHGGITIFSNPDNTWAGDYAAIRRATIFLNNFKAVPMKNIYERNARLGEARTLRAFFYWELVRRWGGVPLLGDNVKTLTDDIELPRRSFESCIDYIVSECDKAKDSLRTDPVDDNDLGRWTKAGAMALKAQVLLFAASPLYNGGNTGDSLTGYTGNDPARWQRAAAAAKDVMDMNIYKLDSPLNQIFVETKSPEIIFARIQTTGKTVEQANAPINFSAGPSAGYTSPTQELVDAFGMSNGKPITDPSSGYDENNPYANRDPRLAATVFCNGAAWLGGTVETFDGGLSRPGGSIVQTRTSYYMRKFLGSYETGSSFQNIVHDWPCFRYAEVLLDYAEAQNEFAGPDASVYNAVEATRKRAGLDPYTLDPGLTADDMRTIIRNERRVELAFEEHRYWDIRRWKIAGSVYNKPLHGMEIIKNAAGTFTYAVQPVFTTSFDESKMYFYPIPYTEMVSNNKMRQNPGW